MEKWLSYDNVALIPIHVSTLEHRNEADLSVQFGPIKLDVPMIAAPMPDVSNGKMASTLGGLGSFGIIHRFQTIEQQVMELYQFLGHKSRVGVAIGVTGDTVTRTKELYEAGARIFCIDTANGVSQLVRQTIIRLRSWEDVFVIAGNVASREAFYKLEEWGADAIRVGIAGGSVCETRTQTGIYSPMATAIKAIGSYVDMYDEPLPKPIPAGWINYTFKLRTAIAKPRKALLIADGGIKTPGDMCKALALGADLVMVGGVFAGTSESPGEVLKIDGKKYKVMRGAASYSVQNGNSEYVEGAETIVNYQGSVEKVIRRFTAGLRSSMSYMNARNLEEYRKNVEVIQI